MPDWNSADDIRLMRRIQQQEQQALSALYDQYGGAVYSLAVRMLQNTVIAEEVTQDVFMRIWDNAGKWEAEKGKLISWMLTMTRYISIDRIRKENRRPDVIDTSVEDMLSPPSTISRSDDPLWQDGLLLRRLMRELPPEQAQVIELGFFGGLTHQEISDQTATPLGTVKTRIRLGLQKLREMWLNEHERIDET